MGKEYILVLNEREKLLTEALNVRLASGEFPAQKSTNQTNIIRSQVSYEYRSLKHENIIQGEILDCHYKLRYQDRNRVFFSAWDCNDVCSVFYDMLAMVYVMNHAEPDFSDSHDPFDLDLRPERYVFCTGESAVLFTEMADQLNRQPMKITHSSQYIFFLFEEPDQGEYEALIGLFKTSGYSAIRVLQIWIRGEILYYVEADGAVLRSEHQRDLTPKEEADVTRKILKNINNKFRTVEFPPPEG